MNTHSASGPEWTPRAVVTMTSVLSRPSFLISCPTPLLVVCTHLRRLA